MTSSRSDAEALALVELARSADKLELAIKIWLKTSLAGNLRSRSTIEQYVNDIGEYCSALGKTSGMSTKVISIEAMRLHKLINEKTVRSCILELCSALQRYDCVRTFGERNAAQFQNEADRRFWKPILRNKKSVRTKSLLMAVSPIK